MLHIINNRHQEKPMVEKDFVILKWGDPYCCVFWLWFHIQNSSRIFQEYQGWAHAFHLPSCSQMGSASMEICFCFYLQEYWRVTSYDTKQSKDVPLFLLAACLDGAAGMGFPLPIPSRTSGLPLILTLGFALKPLMLLKWKLFSPSVFGALHTLKKQQIFALLCLYDGFCLYRSQISSQNL